MLKPFECPYLTRGLKIVDDGQTYPCCDFNKKFGMISYRGLDQYFNDPLVLDRQAQMERGSFPSGCELCWVVESRGGESHRLQAIKNYDLLNLDRRYLELNTGNDCNSDCVMCHPHSSTKIARRIKLEGAAPGEAPGWPAPRNNWIDSEEFWEDLYANIHTVGNISILGGEPFMSKKIWTRLSHPAIQAARGDITLQVTTNASRVQPHHLAALEGWGDVIVNVSIDAIGPQFEWIRHGLRWATVERNFHTLRARPGIITSISYTMGVFSLTGLPELIAWADSTNTPASAIPVKDPLTQRLTAAPINVLRLTRQRLASMKVSPMNKTAHHTTLMAIDHAIENNHWMPAVLANTTDYYNRHRARQMDPATLRLIDEN